MRAGRESAVSDYGRQWQAAQDQGERHEFAERSLRDSLAKHKAALEWIATNVPGGRKLVLEALEAAGYDPNGAVE